MFNIEPKWVEICLFLCVFFKSRSEVCKVNRDDRGIYFFINHDRQHLAFVTCLVGERSTFESFIKSYTLGDVDDGVDPR